MLAQSFAQDKADAQGEYPRRSFTARLLYGPFGNATRVSAGERTAFLSAAPAMGATTRNRAVRIVLFGSFPHGNTKVASRVRVYCSQNAVWAA